MKQHFKQTVIVISSCSSCNSFYSNYTTTMRGEKEINAVLFQGQCSVQTDGLALALCFKVGAERQQLFWLFFYGLSIIFF